MVSPVDKENFVPIYFGGTTAKININIALPEMGVSFPLKDSLKRDFRP
jgi:hypothetical protein